MMSEVLGGEPGLSAKLLASTWLFFGLAIKSLAFFVILIQMWVSHLFDLRVDVFITIGAHVRRDTVNSHDGFRIPSASLDHSANGV